MTRNQRNMIIKSLKRTFKKDNVGNTGTCAPTGKDLEKHQFIFFGNIMLIFIVWRCYTYVY